MAAPPTPIWKTNINIGSKIMFVTSPATELDQVNNGLESSENLSSIYKRLNICSYTTFHPLSTYQWHIEEFLYP